MAIHVQFKSSRASTQGKRVRSAISNISTKTADTLAIAKLRHTIDDLEDEISLQMCAIGEIIYATHCGNPSGSDEIQKILEYIDDLSDQVEGHEQQIKLLMGITPCPICCEDVEKDDVFCQKCGQPLPITPQDQN